MHRSILASVIVLAVVAAGCTAGTDEADEDATLDPVVEAQDAAEDGEDAATDPGPVIAARVTELPLDVDDLVGTDPLEEAFSPAALEVVGTNFHAFGQRATPDGGSLPAIYRSALDDGRDWEPLELELPDDIVSGSVRLPDAPGVTVLQLRDEQDRTRVEVRQRTTEPRLVAVIDDADLAFVRNIAFDDGGFLAVGTRQDGEVRRPALWSIRDGEVTAVELPDDERLQSDRIGFDSAVLHEGRYRIVGTDADADGLLWLEGSDLDALEVIDTPDGLEDAVRVSTMVVADGVLWAGGASAGSVSGELAIWSMSSDAGFDDRTDTIWPDRQIFSSSASRLASGTFPSRDPFVAVVEGGRTLWWRAEGDQVVETGLFGGTLVAYESIGGSVVTFDTGNGAWRVGFEDAEVSLPASSTLQDAPRLRGVGPDAVTVTLGWRDAARTLVFDADGQRLGEVGGSLGWDRVAGLQTLTGTLPQVALRPAAARVVDGEVVTVELEFDGDGGSARATAALTDGSEELIVGHRFLDRGMAPLAWALDGTRATPTDRFDELLAGRGFAGACGPTTAISYDTLERIGVAWPFAAGGPVDVVLDQVLPFGTITACLEAADGTVWIADEQRLIALSEDGTVEEYPQPQLRSAYGLQVIEFDGVEFLVALVRDEMTADGNRLWTAPLEDPSRAVASERIEIPVEVGRPGIQGFDQDTATYTLAARVGTVYRLFELEVGPA